MSNYKCLIQVLNEMFSLNDSRRQLEQRLKGKQSEADNKENNGSDCFWPPRSAQTCIGGRQQQQQSSEHLASSQPSFMLMNKRQLISTLQEILLTDIKSVLVERAHEFTDCAYTKHEHRETILVLIYCIKLQLSKLVKLIYKLVSLSFH